MDHEPAHAQLVSINTSRLLPPPPPVIAPPPYTPLATTFPTDTADQDGFALDTKFDSDEAHAFDDIAASPPAPASLETLQRVDRGYSVDDDDDPPPSTLPLKDVAAAYIEVMPAGSNAMTIMMMMLSASLFCVDA